MNSPSEADEAQLPGTDATVPHPEEIFVGGSWTPAFEGRRLEVLSPADGSFVVEVAAPGIAEAEAAVSAADDAFKTGPWPRTPVAERVEICRRFCEKLAAEFDDLGQVWAVESGMPVAWSDRLHRYAAEPAWTAALATASHALESEGRESPAGEVVLTREPVGPVLALLPYNGPIATIGTKVVPALLAGCPVIVKAAPESALVSRRIAECARTSGFPAGTISIIAADTEVSRHLAKSCAIALISLTGGAAAARDIIESTLDRLPRTVLELGGKSPAILLEDFDLSAALPALLAGAMSGAGQVCTTLSRILVPEGREDEVAAAMAEAYAALRIGPPLDPATQHGPLVNRRAWERSRDFVDGATREGARVVAGGGRPSEFPDGWYFAPTLLADVTPTMTVAREEVFGPVTCVIPYKDVEEAVQIANQSELGLAGAVFGSDADLAMTVAGRLEAGSVAINTVGPTLTAPYGGVKSSGWGREGGPEGIREFTAIKQILTRRGRSG